MKLLQSSVIPVNGHELLLLSLPAALDQMQNGRDVIIANSESKRDSRGYMMRSTTGAIQLKRKINVGVPANGGCRLDNWAYRSDHAMRSES
jgi:hypothetical protein